VASPEAIVEPIILAVHEIVISAIVHGNGGRPHKREVFTISRTPYKLKIVIAHEGDGINPDHLPDPLSAEGRQRGSGRGVHLARICGRILTCNATLRAGLQQL
jgi:anti-sigma regulatory factor (Ser/Thr protein kinase)